TAICARLARSNNSHSNEILKAALVAQGANTNETTSVAASSNNHGCVAAPLTLASTAPAPKINAGMQRGNTSKAIRTFAARNPSVSAAPTEPTKLRTGVPSSKDTVIVASVFSDNPN